MLKSAFLLEQECFYEWSISKIRIDILVGLFEQGRIYEWKIKKN